MALLHIRGGMWTPATSKPRRLLPNIPEGKTKLDSWPKKERTLPAKLIGLSLGSENVKWKWMVSSEPALILLFQNALDTD